MVRRGLWKKGIYYKFICLDIKFLNKKNLKMENNIVVYMIKKIMKRFFCLICSFLLLGYMYGFNMVFCLKVSKLY